MFELLSKYSHKGEFNFKVIDSLGKVCNAPTDKSGVYLVWDATNPFNKELLYIGRSGKKIDGQIIHRKAGLGGMKDRLVNGHQFDKNPRKKIWPIIMEQTGIKQLSINWYDTEDDDPVEIERSLLAEAVKLLGTLPKWNNQAY